MTERSFGAGVVEMLAVEQEIAALLKTLYPPDEAMLWLQTPAPFLRGEIPARVIASGDGRRVLDFLRAVCDGAHS